MRNFSVHFIIWTLVIQLATPVFAEDQLLQMSLEQCVDYALQHNPDLRMDMAGNDETLALRNSARGHFGPVFSTEGNIMRWDSASEMQLMGEGDAPDLSTLPPALLQALGPLFENMSKPLTTREQWTGGISVSVTQPLTNLWTIAEAYNMADYGVDLSKMKQVATQHSVTYQVVETYFRVLQTRSYLKIAEKSRESVAAHVERARLFFEQGLIPESDYLKAKVGLAQVDEGVIKARSGVELTSTLLGNLLGVPSGQTVTVQNGNQIRFDEQRKKVAIELEGGHSGNQIAIAVFEMLLGFPLQEILERILKDNVNVSSLRGDLDELQRRAERQRPEIKMVDAQIGMSRAGKRLAISQMLPSLAVSGSYMSNKGSKFQDETSWYIGGFLTWNFWEWGATYYQINAAEARLSKAQIGRQKLADYIRLEVKQAYLKLKESQESLTVASASIDAASEALRIEKLRFDQHLSTSTDVLDAEMMQLGASMRQAAARYDFMVATAAFRKAVGESIL